MPKQEMPAEGLSSEQQEQIVTTAFKDDLHKFVQICLEQGYLKSQKDVNKFEEILRQAQDQLSRGAQSYAVRGLIQNRTKKEIGKSIDIVNFSLDLLAFQHIKKKAYALLKDLTPIE